MVSVIPLHDEREHERTLNCWCNPEVRWRDTDTGDVFPNGPMVVHHSKDQREVLERLLKEGLEQKQWGVFEA